MADRRSAGSGRDERSNGGRAPTVVAQSDDDGARSRTRRDSRSQATALRIADQSVLSQGSARQLRQARADADAGADQHRRQRRPPDWNVRYWDENLLQGPPPLDPFPEVVGITVHLTFAKRAYELARWYRERGAKVVLGGLHVLFVPRRGRGASPMRSRSAKACSSGRESSRRRGRHARSRLPRRLSRSPTATTRRRAATCCRARGF